MSQLTRPLTGDEILFLQLFLNGMVTRLAEAGAMTYDEGLSLTNVGAYVAVACSNKVGFREHLEALEAEKMPQELFDSINSTYTGTRPTKG